MNFGHQQTLFSRDEDWWQFDKIESILKLLYEIDQKSICIVPLSYNTEQMAKPNWEAYLKEDTPLIIWKLQNMAHLVEPTAYMESQVT